MNNPWGGVRQRPKSKAQQLDELDLQVAAAVPEHVDRQLVVGLMQSAAEEIVRGRQALRDNPEGWTAEEHKEIEAGYVEREKMTTKDYAAQLETFVAKSRSADNEDARDLAKQYDAARSAPVNAESGARLSGLLDRVQSNQSAVSEAYRGLDSRRMQVAQVAAAEATVQRLDVAHHVATQLASTGSEADRVQIIDALSPNAGDSLEVRRGKEEQLSALMSNEVRYDESAFQAEKDPATMTASEADLALRAMHPRPTLSGQLVYDVSDPEELTAEQADAELSRLAGNPKGSGRSNVEQENYGARQRRIMESGKN